MSANVLNQLDEYTAASQPATADSLAPKSCSIIEQDPPPFHNARDPQYTIQTEKAQHRVMCYMKIEGCSNLEIARRLEVSAVCVSNVLRQPWAQKFMVEEIRRTGGNEVQVLLEGAVADSVRKLIEIRDTAEADRDALNAANSLLDRVYGKPNQPITTHKGQDLNTLPDSQIAALIPSTTATQTSK